MLFFTSLAGDHHTHQATWLMWPFTLKALLRILVVLCIASHTLFLCTSKFFGLLFFISLFIMTHWHWNELLSRADCFLFSIELYFIKQYFIYPVLNTDGFEYVLVLFFLFLMLYYFCIIFQQLISSGIVSIYKGSPKSKLNGALMLICISLEIYMIAFLFVVLSNKPILGKLAK